MTISFDGLRLPALIALMARSGTERAISLGVMNGPPFTPSPHTSHNFSVPSRQKPIPAPQVAQVGAGFFFLHDRVLQVPPPPSDTSCEEVSGSDSCKSPCRPRSRHTFVYGSASVMLESQVTIQHRSLPLPLHPIRSVYSTIAVYLRFSEHLRFIPRKHPCLAYPLCIQRLLPVFGGKLATRVPFQHRPARHSKLPPGPCQSMTPSGSLHWFASSPSSPSSPYFFPLFFQMSSPPLLFYR